MVEFPVSAAVEFAPVSVTVEFVKLLVAVAVELPEAVPVIVELAAHSAAVAFAAFGFFKFAEVCLYPLVDDGRI